MNYKEKIISINDVDSFDLVQISNELEPNHPGFSDIEYRKRRTEIEQLYYNFKNGRIPTVIFTEIEVKTWNAVLKTLQTTWKNYACSEYLKCFSEMSQILHVGGNQIPQLCELSDFLYEKTKWGLRPALGLLSSRQFLAGLAFRIHHTIPYLRHHSDPAYSPEPDYCHDVLGHVVMLSSELYSQVANLFGRVSLEVDDEKLKELSAIYWWTIEFGLIKQNGQIKAYGAALLSCACELQWVIESGKAEIRPFDLETMSKHQNYIPTSFQQIYYIANSISDVLNELKSYFLNLTQNKITCG